MPKSACLFALLSLLPIAATAAPLAVNGLAHIGDLALTFDAGRWTIDGADDRYVITCHAHDCFRTTIAVTIADGEDAACTPESLPGDPDGAFSPTAASPVASNLLAHISEPDLGCRNWAGGPVTACTTYAGRTYLFEAPGFGCHTMHDAASRVAGVLKGLRPQ